MTRHSWLSHYIIFQIRKENELTDQTFMMSFAWIFSFSSNQKIMLSLSREKNIFEDFEAQTKEGRPRGQGGPGGLPTLEESVEQEREQEVFIDFDDCIEEKEDTDFLTD